MCAETTWTSGPGSANGSLHPPQADFITYYLLLLSKPVQGRALPLLFPCSIKEVKSKYHFIASLPWASNQHQLLEPLHLLVIGASLSPLRECRFQAHYSRNHSHHSCVYSKSALVPLLFMPIIVEVRMGIQFIYKVRRRECCPERSHILYWEQKGNSEQSRHKKRKFQSARGRVAGKLPRRKSSKLFCVSVWNHMEIYLKGKCKDCLGIGTFVNLGIKLMHFHSAILKM